jgi:GTP cyclohydrolase IA
VPKNEEIIGQHVAGILQQLGYDKNDQHFEKTPARVAKLLLEFAKNGEDSHAEEILSVAFDDEHDALVQVGPIRVVSYCAHHMLPVTGWAWVGYLPDQRVCGLSKLARITHHYAHQLTVQERVTQQIANALEAHLKPKGVMVVIRAEHGCMSIRGVREPISQTVTSAVRGVFREESDARSEFLSLMSEAKLS